MRGEAGTFSGLHTSQRPAAKLLDEFLSGHARALGDAPRLRGHAMDRYVAEERLAKMIANFRYRDEPRDFLGEEFWNLRKVFQFAMSTSRKVDLFPRGYMLAPPVSPDCRIIRTETFSDGFIDAATSPSGSLAMVGASGADVRMRGRLRHFGWLEDVYVAARLGPAGQIQLLQPRVNHTTTRTRRPEPMSVIDLALHFTVPADCTEVTLSLRFREASESDPVEIRFARLTLEG